MAQKRKIGGCQGLALREGSNKVQKTAQSLGRLVFVNGSPGRVVGDELILGESKWQVESVMSNGKAVLSLTKTTRRTDREEKRRQSLDSLEDELHKRRQEVMALAEQARVLQRLCENGENVDENCIELGRLLCAKGNHMKRIKELEQKREMQVSITVVKKISMLKIQASIVTTIEGEEPFVWLPSTEATTLRVQEVEETNVVQENLLLLDAAKPFKGNTIRQWGEQGKESGRFQEPQSIAVAQNCVYVLDNWDALHVFDTTGRHQKKLPLKWHTRCFALSQAQGCVRIILPIEDGWIVTDGKGNHLRECIASESFGDCASIACTGSHVYVLNTNGFVFVYDSADGRFLQKWQCRYPEACKSITLSSRQVFVTSRFYTQYGELRIQQFTIDGTFLGSCITNHFRRQMGCIFGDIGTSVRGDTLIVGTGSGILVVELESLNVVESFVLPNGSKFESLACSEEGEVFALDSLNFRVSVFR